MKNTDTITLKLTRREVNDIIISIHAVTASLDAECEFNTSEVQAERAYNTLAHRWYPLLDKIVNQIYE